VGQVPEKKWSLRALVGRNGRHLQEVAFEQLAARLLLAEPTQQAVSFLITSPEPGAGKSTITANLGIALAEAGQRVLLLDMDFYRPRLASLFAVREGPGLSDYLSGKIPFAAALRSTAYANLRIATAGVNRERTAELLKPHGRGSVPVRELLDTAAREADLVLIDSPAFLAVADSAVIAAQADAVLLVVARRRTARKQLRFALHQLTALNARVTGLVMNKMPDSRLYGYYARGRMRRGDVAGANAATGAVPPGGAPTQTIDSPGKRAGVA
jgi:capsular exopolysaccharide synthesis family protein